MRIGHGFDVHAFGGEGPIIIGGVRIPYEKGLLAHSDGDVALHALTDALLGAAALGDIGKLFPDTDPAFKGADSRELFARSLAADSGQRLYPRKRRCHDHCSGAENAAAYSADACLYRRRPRLPYG
ncbi:2-C-methyl-D-erythritol 2,4-cyclo diphosphate synthase [Raoultella ornithinolytica]|nr:2-C-methyl-D-erythritol 2,4-cyclo diphosphate synthase [Raoultella ornithinolytica]